MRLVKEINGFDLTVEDVFSMQQMCAYEVRFYFYLSIV